MKWLVSAVVALAALGVTAQAVLPLFSPPPPVALETSAREVLPKDFPTLDAVLARRAPGLGLTLRKQLAVAIAEEAQAAGFDPLLILGIIDVESDYREDAVSYVGARGLMQIRPETLFFLAQKEGLKLSAKEVQADPALCVRLGVRYLKQLKDQFNGDLDYALLAYNIGPNGLRQAARAHQLEPYKRYVYAVKREYRTLRLGEGLGDDWALASRASSGAAR